MTDKLRTKIAALMTILALGGLAGFAMASNPGPVPPAQPASATSKQQAASPPSQPQGDEQQGGERDD